jgi:uncharacterized protein YegP (UPF0339 family)
MAGKFVLFTATDGQCMFNLKAGNGETILTSERYQSKDEALNGIYSVRKNASLDERFEVPHGQQRCPLLRAQSCQPPRNWAKRNA